jgi:hypothetical protein
MTDPLVTEGQLCRFVAHLLDSGVSVSSLGIELLTLGLVMLTQEEQFRHHQNRRNYGDWPPRDTGYSAFG